MNADVCLHHLQRHNKNNKKLVHVERLFVEVNSDYLTKNEVLILKL